MAKTRTAEKPKTKPKVAETARNAGPVATAAPAQAPTGLRLRVPYPRAWGEAHGISIDRWQVLIDAVWPSARTPEAVCLAIEYCKFRFLDPMKKMVHIVPVYLRDAGEEDEEGRKKGAMIETVWPSIAEIRITATRTGVYAGKDATVFGPDVTETFTNTYKGKSESVTVTYPEWAQLTVYRMVQGQRCAFVGPKVIWKEAYATKSRWSLIPNEMWQDRKQGQLDKCTEAAALRSAFPEELGGEQTAEEMYGRIVDLPPMRLIDSKPLADGEVRPKAGGGGEFRQTEPGEKSQSKPDAAGAKPPEAAKAGDPRPEPPAEGFVVVSQSREPGPAASAPSIRDAVVDGVLADGVEKLKQINKTSDLPDLMELVEQELPPDSQQLKDWILACDARRQELIAAGKRVKGNE